MALQIAQDRLFLAGADIDLQDTGIEGFVVQLAHELVLHQGQGFGRFVRAVDHRRQLALATQAAARTFPRPGAIPAFSSNVAFMSYSPNYVDKRSR